MDDAESSFEDLEAMVEEVNRALHDDLRAMLQRGISLYDADDDGNVYELAPDGRRYLVELQDDKLVRIRHVGYSTEFDLWPNGPQEQAGAADAKTNPQSPEHPQ